MTEHETVALEFVNMIRKDQGREPLSRLPRGIPGSPFHCPIANGINKKFNAQVAGFSATYTRKKFLGLGKKTRAFPVPPPVGQFIVAFDEGELPHLIQR